MGFCDWLGLILTRAYIYILFEVVFYIKGIGHQARVSSQHFVKNSVISRL
nr:MAG TPA: hypothetical protein [Caudoviricetes sp.]